MTHAFMYGTATFEGIRGYWNAEQETLYVLFVREHLERIRNSAKMLLMENVPPVDELVEIVLETVRRNHYREDVYIRPSFYKSTKAIGVRLHHLDHELYVITSPFGNYIDIEKGVRVMTSHLAAQRGRGAAGPGQDRRRVREHGVPEVRGGAQRLRRGPGDDARRPRVRGVRGEPVHGPRRGAHHAAGLGRHPRGRDPQGDPDPGRRTSAIPTEVRSVDRSELYVCDEVFLCGTGVQVSPVIELDHRAVGTGAIGPISRRISERYFARGPRQRPGLPGLAHRDRGVARGTARAPSRVDRTRGRQPTASTFLSGASLPSVMMKSTLTAGSVTGTTVAPYSSSRYFTVSGISASAPL